MGKYGDITKMSLGSTAPTEPTGEDIKIPSKISPKISSEISPSVVSTSDTYVDVVRKAVRWPGKESAPLRITADELNKLKTVVRYFEDNGYFTDRTQIIRIAVNYALDDFERNGDKSVLAEIMRRINTY